MKSPKSVRRLLAAAAATAAALCAVAPLQAADNASVVISDGPRFAETDGESLYRAVCQSCHMAEGQGARGAAAYPALARNPKVAAGAYVAYNVLKGRKGMPGFGHMMSDEQVAAVTNYVRTHLGNAYPEPFSAADVKALR